MSVLTDLIIRARSLLFRNREPTDPITYGVVVVSMLTVAVLASVVPARRAATVDPAIAFRSD